MGKQSEIVGSYQLEDCTNCPVGRVAPSTGTTSCPRCVAGKYIDSVGQTDCISCGIGKYSFRVSAISPSNCTDCPAGKYSGTTGNDELADCLDCDAGKYHLTLTTGETDDSNCLSCNTGYWSDAGTAADGMETDPTKICYCDLGYGRATDVDITTACTACEIGHYSDNYDNQDCHVCPSGRYQGSTTQAFCTPCPAGTWMHTQYTTQIEDTQCTDCHANFTSSEGTAGLTNTDSCYCDKGYYDLSGNTDLCLACPSGYYKTVSGDNIACTGCNKGKYMTHFYTAQPDDLQCTNCVAGRYNDVTGRMWDMTGDAACTICPTTGGGTLLQSYAGSDSVYDCLAPTGQPTGFPTGQPTTQPTLRPTGQVRNLISSLF